MRQIPSDRTVKIVIVLTLPPLGEVRHRPWWHPWRGLMALTDRRLLQEITRNPIDLWTFQTPKAYRALQETGTLHGRTDDKEPTWTAAYSWIRHHAESALPTTGDGLLWFWSSTTPKNLRRQASAARGDVLLRVRLPRDRVLVSDSSAWHIVLNLGLDIPDEPGETGEAWHQRAATILDDWHRRLADAGVDGSLPIDAWPTDLRTEAEHSWSIALDTTAWPSGAHLQP